MTDQPRSIWNQKLC